MKQQRFAILDGGGLTMRSYHRRGRSRRSRDGRKTTAVDSFCGILFPLMRELNPDYLVMALDVPRHTTFRRALDPEYKANRDESEAKKIGPHIDMMIEVAEVLGVPLLQVETFEADDIIASLVDVCASDEVECVVVSSDHDMHQVVGPHCRVYDAFKDLWFDERAVSKVWGVPPEKVVEVMTLMGDSGDNVSGVPGLGTVNATKLIQDYGTAAKAVDSAGEWANTKIQMALATTKLDLCRQLVELRKDVELDICAQDLAFDGLDAENAEELFHRLGLRSSY